jgi:hypothetical protein
MKWTRSVRKLIEPPPSIRADVRVFQAALRVCRSIWVVVKRKGRADGSYEHALKFARRADP